MAGHQNNKPQYSAQKTTLKIRQHEPQFSSTSCTRRATRRCYYTEVVLKTSIRK